MLITVLSTLIIAALAFGVLAEPTGTTISSNSTDPGGSSNPSNRSDSGGTITTMVLDAFQQNTKWKAYIGNITGSLTLDDSSGNTIYDWSLNAAGISGEVYVSRASSISWSLIDCAVQGIIDTEHTALSIGGGDADSINATYNYTTHNSIVVAGQTINADACGFATHTFESDTRQAQGSANFQAVLLDDDTNLVYATPISQDTTAYDSSTPVDFQVIVADDPSTADTTYYFYAEIEG